MNIKKYVPSLLALATLGVMIAYFPPGQFGWRFFAADRAPIIKKVFFLLKVYGTPACMSFLAVVFFRLQSVLSMKGAPSEAMFPVALFGSAAMMGALRSMVSGFGGVPGYALGMAAAYTVMSRVSSIGPSEQKLFGRPMLKIVWRTSATKVRGSQPMAVARGMEPNASLT